eukprot:maker-scaffold576_size132709-snap-gene-0.17 protein:Tk05425 transcript:maker-scaffold576_size132709-snap-gene-0.17-mRNA-1 annotation:"hypothetical protein DAPPUDRAFT_96285"
MKELLLHLHTLLLKNWKTYLPIIILVSTIATVQNGHYFAPNSPNSIQLEVERSLENADPNREVFQKMDIAQCACSKLVPTNEIPRIFPFTKDNTTCDTSTWIRGPHQNVIGFSYFEHPNKAAKAQSRKYLQGIQDNLELIQKYYPGYVMRLYHNLSPESPVMESLCHLTCHEPMLDLCDISQNPRLGNATVLYATLWRFLPVLDVQVDTFFSRDLDSRVNPREVAAVQQFLDSRKAFHVMRDHPAHSTYIMAGMWGAKVNKLRKNFIYSFRDLFKNKLAYLPNDEGGYDQIALLRYVWKWAKKDLMAHDSYNCYKFASAQAFPTQRARNQVGNFVGSVVSLNSTLTEGK